MEERRGSSRNGGIRKQMIPEYDDKDPSTWEVINQPSVDPVLLKRLTEVGGLNPFGEPVLQLRWGVTYQDPQTLADEPKYLYVVKEPTLIGFEYKDNGETKFVKKLEEVPAHVLIPVPKYNDVKLGERRWIVEQWRSAEFLQKSNRYKFTHDNGDAEIKVSCKNCGGPVRATGREDERRCVLCGSTRVSVVEFNEIKHERLLHDLPRKGCWDFFMRLETPEGKYRPFDGEALLTIEQEWRRRQRSAQTRQREVTQLRQQAGDRTRQLRREVWHPDNLLKKEVV
jgi:hypothetical protein